MSAATVGLGCDCCQNSDARPLLRLEALARANASSMLELETWRSAEMDAALEGFEEAHALAHREVVSQFRVRA